MFSIHHPQNTPRTHNCKEQKSAEMNDQGYLQGVINKTEHLSIGAEPDTSKHFPLYVEPGNVLKDTTDVTLDNSRTDDELNGTREGALGFDSSVKMSGRASQEKDTDQTLESSKMATEQETGALVSAEEHASALKTIKQLTELNEKLSKDIRIAQETRTNNQQSEEAVAESNQASLDKDDEDDDVKGDDGASKEESIVDIIPAIHSNECMNENDASKIQRHIRALSLNIEPKEIIIELYSLFVFDGDEFDFLLEYLEEKGMTNCMLKILRKLNRKGKNSYIRFLVALERCKYTGIIQLLEPDCVIYEGRVKYSGQKFYELIDNTSAKYREFVERCEKNIEDVYHDHPGQQFVVVKKLAKGCVEVTFHLISLGYNNDEDLRRPLQDLVKSGFINTDPVKPDEFYFRQITDKELASERESMTQRRIIVLEKEIETLKVQINELLMENVALKATSANSQEMEKYKGHLATKYTDKLQDKELIISSLQEQLNQQATGTNVDKADRTDYNRLDQDKESDLTVLPIDDNKDKGKEEKGKDAERLDKDKHLTLLTKDDGHDDARVTYREYLSVIDLIKIRHIIDYLVTRHPDKLKPLVQLLVDKGVIDDDDDSKQITMDIDRDDIKVARRRLSYIINSSFNSYLHLIGCLKELGLSNIVARFDEEYPDWYGVESSKPLGTKKTDLMGFEENKKHLKEREKKQSMEFSSAHTSQSRSSPD